MLLSPLHIHTPFITPNMFCELKCFYLLLSQPFHKMIKNQGQESHGNVLGKLWAFNFCNVEALSIETSDILSVEIEAGIAGGPRNVEEFV